MAREFLYYQTGLNTNTAAAGTIHSSNANTNQSTEEFTWTTTDASADNYITGPLYIIAYAEIDSVSTANRCVLELDVGGTVLTRQEPFAMEPQSSEVQYEPYIDIFEWTGDPGNHSGASVEWKFRREGGQGSQSVSVRNIQYLLLKKKAGDQLLDTYNSNTMPDLPVPDGSGASNVSAGTSPTKLGEFKFATAENRAYCVMALATQRSSGGTDRQVFTEWRFNDGSTTPSAIGQEDQHENENASNGRYITPISFVKPFTAATDVNNVATGYTAEKIEVYGKAGGGTAYWFDFRVLALDVTKTADLAAGQSNPEWGADYEYTHDTSGNRTNTAIGSTTYDPYREAHLGSPNAFDGPSLTVTPSSSNHLLIGSFAGSTSGTGQYRAGAQLRMDYGTTGTASNASNRQSISEPYADGGTDGYQAEYRIGAHNTSHAAQAFLGWQVVGPDGYNTAANGKWVIDCRAAISSGDTTRLYNNSWLINLQLDGGTTQVGKSLGVFWDVREAVSDTVTASWDVRQAIVDTLVASWDVRQAVADTLVASWDVRQAVADTLAASWDVRQAVADTLAASWDVRQAIADTLAASWDVRTTVSDTLAASWDVRQAVADTLAASWDVRQAIADTLAASWDVRTTVSDTLAASWDVRQAIVDTLVASWDVRQAVADTLVASWDVLRTAVRVYNSATETWQYASVKVYDSTSSSWVSGVGSRVYDTNTWN